ncbi:hypothetical protein [Leptolyngbya sp. PCC 6406]|uniref:hypothetical protein n=1 Tax=Leptolyngbya sp. PCC 6406 TaxID=1173264 RepID=UPI0002ACD92C|nr:hypothetical protein [Leptolyngbya sp. PCC 6406]
MEPIKAQVTTLTQKVDALHQLIDQVNDRVSEILSRSQLEEGGPNAAIYPNGSGLSVSAPSGLGEIHKDVLVDSTYVNPGRSGSDQVLSPEVQIQRLTAQLTAAYNRIAALEEQLLANRVH